MNENMTKEEADAFMESEKDCPVKTRVFRHKTKDFYTIQIDIFNLGEYEEVTK